MVVSIEAEPQPRGDELAAVPENRSTRRRPDVVFISWAPYCSRSDNIARELGGKSYMIYHPVWGSHPATIAMKYFTQTIATLYVLFRDRPESVICMSPPFPSIASAWLYCLLFGKRYGIDYHTAAFTHRAQRAFFFVQAFFARRAAINTLTNEYLAEIVRRWGGKTMLVSDVRVVFDEFAPYEGLKDAFNVTFVGRYSKTEPLDAVYAAARELAPQGVHFYVTGDLRHASPDVIETRPDNVTLTDFQPDPVYAGLLRDSDAVLCLCANDNTMQRGAYEAMAAETPLILSDWQILRDTFARGSTFVPNTVQGIVDGVMATMKNHGHLSAEIKEQKRERSEHWESVLARLRESLGLPERR